MKTVVVILLFALAFQQALSQSSSGSERLWNHPLIQDRIGVDHVLVWAQNQTTAEHFLQNKLGFRPTEKAGNYGGGISNKLVWFENFSFIEFLWLSDPELTKREAPNEYSFVKMRNGSNGYGIEVADIDLTYQALVKGGLKPDKPSGESYDPDGPDGPKPPVVNRWRYMFLEKGKLAGNPFFVEYEGPGTGPKPDRTQPNGSRKLSAVWVLVKDVKIAEVAYKNAQFKRRGKISLPHIDAEGVALHAGEAEIFLIKPKRNSSLEDRLNAYGDHVVGMSIQVARLTDTENFLRDSLEKQLMRRSSTYGNSILAPTLETLGIFIEFHE